MKHLPGEMHRLSPSYLKNKYPDRDKQYWVLSAIYRIVRVNQWPQTTAARLLHERAKYTEEMAKGIASLWFGHGKKETIPMSMRSS